MPRGLPLTAELCFPPVAATDSSSVLARPEVPPPALGIVNVVGTTAPEPPAVRAAVPRFVPQRVCCGPQSDARTRRGPRKGCLEWSTAELSISRTSPGRQPTAELEACSEGASGSGDGFRAKVT